MGGPARHQWPCDDHCAAQLCGHSLDLDEPRAMSGSAPSSMPAALRRRLEYAGPALFSYGFRPFFLGAAVWAALTIAALDNTLSIDNVALGLLVAFGSRCAWSPISPSATVCMQRLGRTKTG